MSAKQTAWAVQDPNDEVVLFTTSHYEETTIEKFIEHHYYKGVKDCKGLFMKHFHPKGYKCVEISIEVIT